MNTITDMAWTGAAAVLAQGGGADGGRTLLDHINSGGVVGYIIIGLSVIALALIVAHLVQIRRPRLAPEEHVERTRELLRSGDVNGAIAYCQAPENKSFFCEVVGAALVRCSRSPFGFLELKSAMEESGQEQVARLYRSTDGIGLIASVAPMLGLLGTVVGMVGAFDVLSATGGAARPDQLAGDISKALITTVMGLIVAIPCTAVYAYFRNRIDHVTTGVGDVIDELTSHLEAVPDQGRSAPGARPGETPRSTLTPPGATVGQGAAGGMLRR